jgi:CubicO group peptidase (beta-lactamase class C family)
MTAVIAFDNTTRQIERRIAGREWLGLQLAVLCGDELVLDLAAGDSAVGVPMTADTPQRWTCSSKVVTAALFAVLEERGVLDVERPVDDYLPGFNDGRPVPITCAHLLNHTAGLAESAEAPFTDRATAVHRAATEPGQPGVAVGQERMYSSFASYAVLAAVAEAATGRGFTELVDNLVFPRAGVDGAGFTVRSAPTWIGDQGEFTPALGSVLPAHAVGSVHPGTGCVGTAADLARVLRLLSPHHPLAPGAAAAYVTRRRPFTPCRRSGDTAEWGLGVVVGPARFGRCASAGAFGHAGCRSSLVLHDPAHDLTIAVVANTISKSMLRAERVKPFIPALYADLAIPSPR